MQDDFDFQVTLSAAEHQAMTRRVVFLESILAKHLHRARAVSEWRSAGELAALNLPGLPATAAGIARRAALDGWAFREVASPGRRGCRREYHYGSLPARAFSALIDRLHGGSDSRLRPRPSILPLIEPPWGFTLLRLYRDGGCFSVRAAWRALPVHLPEAVSPPSYSQARGYILRLPRCLRALDGHSSLRRR